jgi:Flagellar hook-length control protein
MSNELPWTRWTPDDLAPPLAGFTPAVMLPEEGDTEAEVPELSEEEQRAQMLAQMQMQAHEQGFNAGLNEGRQKGQEQGYQEGLAKGLEQGIEQARQQQAPLHVRAALEAALPTLRTSLAENGIQLSQSSVSSESFSGQQQSSSQQQQASRSGQNGGFNEESDELLPTPVSLQSAARGNSAVDIFA